MSLEKGQLILVLGLPDEPFGHQFLGYGVKFMTLAQCPTANEVPDGVALIAYYVPTVKALGDKMTVGLIETIAMNKRLAKPDPIENMEQLRAYISKNSPRRSSSEEDVAERVRACNEFVTSQIPDGVEWRPTRETGRIVDVARRQKHMPDPAKVLAQLKQVHAERMAVIEGQNLVESRPAQQVQEVVVPEPEPVEISTDEPVLAVEVPTLEEPATDMIKQKDGVEKPRTLLAYVRSCYEDHMFFAQARFGKLMAASAKVNGFPRATPSTCAVYIGQIGREIRKENANKSVVEAVLSGEASPLVTKPRLVPENKPRPTIPWFEFLESVLPEGTDFNFTKELHRVYAMSQDIGYHLSYREVLADIREVYDNRVLRATQKDSSNVVGIATHQKAAVTSGLKGFEISHLTREEKVQLIVQLWANVFGVDTKSGMKEMEDLVSNKPSKVI